MVLKKRGGFLCSKSVMVAGHDQNLYEIFADTDSENDEEFEGLSSKSSLSTKILK
jgi:hypothetical protein